MRTDVNEAEQYLKSLIKQGENQKLDFKFEISNAMKMAKTFSAFANTDGGRLLVGVKDNGKISGIRSEEEAYMAESSAHVFCKPEVPYTIKKWEIEGKSVLEIEIPQSKHKPHYAKDEKGAWIAYTRVDDQNIKANRILINVWKKENKEKGIWLSYGEEEQKIIDYLQENRKMSLGKATKIARTSRIRAEKILEKLVLLGVIRIETTEKSVFFSLNSI